MEGRIGAKQPVLLGRSRVAGSRRDQALEPRWGCSAGGRRELPQLTSGTGNQIQKEDTRSH